MVNPSAIRKRNRIETRTNIVQVQLRMGILGTDALRQNQAPHCIVDLKFQMRRIGDGLGHLPLEQPVVGVGLNVHPIIPAYGK